MTYLTEMPSSELAQKIVSREVTSVGVVAESLRLIKDLDDPAGMCPTYGLKVFRRSQIETSLRTRGALSINNVMLI
jgi:hypothetical protein